MELSVIWIGARGIIIHISDGGVFHTRKPWQIYINDILVRTTTTVDTYVDGFLPGCTVSVAIQHEDFSDYQQLMLTLAPERKECMAAVAA